MWFCLLLARPAGAALLSAACLSVVNAASAGRLPGRQPRSCEESACLPRRIAPRCGHTSMGSNPASIRTAWLAFSHSARPPCSHLSNALTCSGARVWEGCEGAGGQHPRIRWVSIGIHTTFTKRGQRPAPTCSISSSVSQLSEDGSASKPCHLTQYSLPPSRSRSASCQAGRGGAVGRGVSAAGMGWQSQGRKQN